MRYVRSALAVFVFTLAASGSIWIGWIYASPDPRLGKPETPANAQAAIRPPLSGVSPRFSVGDFDELPDMGRVNLIPEMPGSSNITTDINGYPTISKEAIEQAAGLSDQSTLPEIEVPFKVGGEGAGLLGDSFELAPR